MCLSVRAGGTDVILLANCKFMGVDFAAYRIHWDDAIADFANGKFFDELADEEGQWHYQVPAGEWQPNGHLWQYAGAALDLIKVKAAKALPPGIDALNDYVGEGARGKREVPLTDQEAFS
jgi:hypothetical protein